MSFKYNEREFQLKAKFEEERDKWFYALKFLSNYSPITTKVSDNFSNNQANPQETIKPKIEIRESNEIKNLELLTILELKRISPFLKNINPNCLKNRLCCGYLMKKGKESLSNYRKRWFLLVSAKPLVIFFQF